MNALDTNVVVYSLDSSDPIKHAKAKTLLTDLVGSADPTILPWQVCGELLNCLRKWEAAGRIAAADVQAHFDDFQTAFPIFVPTPASVPLYFNVFARFSLSHWDALLVAACKEAGATTLYSEDMQDGADYDGVKIVDPFK